MDDENKVDKPIGVREAIVIKLIMFLIKVLHPYDWEHEFTDLYKEIAEGIKIKKP